ncbi:MAG TPA: O-antigen ligase family protein [Vicinamibacteria bacterium]|jgi:O-antigen ligase
MATGVARLPGPLGPAAEATPARAGPAVREDQRPGLVLAFAYAWFLAAARAIDVAESGVAITVFGASFSAAALVAALVRPSWYLPLVVAYLPFSRVYSLPVPGVTGLNVTNLALLAGVVALAGTRARRWPRRRLRAVEGLTLAYVAVGSLSVVPAWFGGHTAGEILLDYRAWLAPVVLFFLARGLVRDRRDVQGVLWVLAWTVLLVALCTWKEGIDRGSRGSIDSARVRGLLEQSNSMGAFLAYYGTPLLAFALTARPLKRALPYLAGFLVTARVTLYTFSRGAYLSTLAGAATVLLLGNPLLFVAASGGGAAAVAAFPALVPDSVRERLGHTQNDSLEAESSLDKSSTYRLIIWRGALRMVAERPAQGVGLNRFAETIEDYTSEVLGPDDPRDAHNAFLLVAAEMGVPALAVLLALFAAWAAAGLRLHRGRRHPVDRRLALAFLGSLSAVAVSGMLGSRFSEEALIGCFWVLAGLTMAVAGMREPPRRPRRRGRPA